MILQALCEYYQRKAADPQLALAPEGFEVKEIPFVIVLDERGHWVPPIRDTREGDGKKRRAKAELVPQGEKKTSGVKANLLWDTVEYALGVDTRGNSSRVDEQHRAFKQRVVDLFGEKPDDAGVRALMTFLRNF